MDTDWSAFSPRSLHTLILILSPTMSAKRSRQAGPSIVQPTTRVLRSSKRKKGNIEEEIIPLDIVDMTLPNVYPSSPRPTPTLSGRNAWKRDPADCEVKWGVKGEVGGYAGLMGTVQGEHPTASQLTTKLQER